MKWKTALTLGDTRTRVVFAWYPTECSDGYTRWSERVVVIEQVVESTAEETYYAYGTFLKWGLVKVTAL
jgi:hypothetical protein